MAQIDEGLVVFLDDDVRVVPDLLEVYAAAARRAGPGQFFGGPVAPDYEEAPPDWLIEFLPLSARGWRPDDPSQAITRPFFLGFNWAAFAGDLRRVGGFSERFGPGSDAGVGDETDMQRRLVTAGLKAVYVPQALVYHWVPRDRCSPEWALERAYRNGIRSGLLKQDAAAGPTIAGYPLVLVKRTVESWVRSKMRRNGQRRERFAAQLKYQRQRGVLRGVLLRSGDRAAGHSDRSVRTAVQLESYESIRVGVEIRVTELAQRNFAITGVGGFIAPRHLKAIHDTGNRLVAAADPHDAVGILDRFSFDVRFFTEFERFDRHLEKLRRGPDADRVHFLSICSPNYLHDAHIRLALRVGADAICEKPLVINPWNLDALQELERETGGRVNTVLQLRVHPDLIALKQRLDASPSSTHDVTLTYVTGRGRWYRCLLEGPG